MVKPYPMDSFWTRLADKFRKIVILVTRISIFGMRKLGTTLVDHAANGNLILELNRTSPLGERGMQIQIPKDHVIFEEIQRYGQWEIRECRFLSRALKRVAQDIPDKKCTFLDIGANTGMVTLQTLSLAGTRPDVLMVEPLARHAEAIRFNTRNLARDHSIRVFEFGLAENSGKASIFTEAHNNGNSSLVESVVIADGAIRTQIKLKGADEFAEENLLGDHPLIIKCDTQGFDAVILSRIPESVWVRTRAAIVEVWAIDEIEEADIDRCLHLWNGFKWMSWSPTKRERISTLEIRNFWLSGTQNSRNLFLTT